MKVHYLLYYYCGYILIVFLDIPIGAEQSDWKNLVDEPHLCQLGRLDLLNLEEITNGQEGDGHCTDANHKNDQRRTVVNVASQVLYRI